MQIQKHTNDILGIRRCVQINYISLYFFLKLTPFDYAEARKYGMIFLVIIVVVLVKVQFNFYNSYHEVSSNLNLPTNVHHLQNDFDAWKQWKHTTCI